MERNNPNFDTAADLEYGSTVPLVGVDMNAPMDGWDNVSPTVPHWAEPEYVDPQAERRDTVPVNPVADNWVDPEDYRPAGGASADGYNPTLPLNYREEKTALRPVTGWLVCVDGTEKGKDYRLHADINYIGRSKNNDVVLGSDPTVSRDRHAMIAYDPRGRMFFFAPAGGTSLIRQNGRPVLTTTELKTGDRLEIGEGTYLFVPLCGDQFEW